MQAGKEPNKTYKGLSRMLDILYSRFCAATVLPSTRSKMKHYYEAVQRQTERIQELLPIFALEGDNFSARTPDIRVDIEHLPQMINQAGARYHPDIQTSGIGEISCNTARCS